MQPYWDKMRSYYLFITSLLGAGLLTAPSSAEVKYIDAIYRGRIETQLGSTIKQLNKREIDQSVMDSLSFFGRDDLLQAARNLYDFDITQVRHNCQVEAGLQNVSPLGKIVEMASEARFVVVNEAHDEPSHRAFMSEVITALRKKGYAKYAAETLATPTDALKTEGFARFSTGFYTNEPEFAGLVEKALRLGYDPIAYEADDPPAGLSEMEARQYRETREAENVLAQIGPNDKVIIHAGFGHARTYPRIRDKDNHPGMMMAEEIQRLTGEKVVSVDQTQCRDSDTANSPWLLKAPDPADRFVDIRVSHAQTEQFEGGRALWRFTDGKRPVAPPWSHHELAQMPKPLLISATVSGRPADAVPSDRVAVVGAEDIKLALVRGNYRLTLTNGSGKVLAKRWLTVK